MQTERTSKTKNPPDSFDQSTPVASNSPSDVHYDVESKSNTAKDGEENEVWPANLRKSSLRLSDRKVLESGVSQRPFGKIKVFLKIRGPISFDIGSESSTYLRLDRRQNKVTLFDPSKGNGQVVSMEERGKGIAAPKLFAFDGIFLPSDSPVKTTDLELVEGFDLFYFIFSGGILCYSLTRYDLLSGSKWQRWLPS